MKFSTCASLFVLAAAVLPSTNAFTPSSPTFANRHVALAPKDASIVAHQQQRLSSSYLGAGVAGAAGILKELDNFGDYDPDDEEDDSRTMKLLGVTIKALELLDGAHSSEIEGEMGSLADDVASKKGVTTDYTDDDDDDVAEDVKPKESEKSHKSQFAEAIDILKALQTQYKKRDTMGYATYPNHPEFPDVDLSGAMKMLDGPPASNHIFSPRKFVRVIRRALQAKIAFDKLGLLDDVDEAKTAEAAYRATFTKAKLFGRIPNPLNLLPKPKHVMKHWEEDKEFARQFMAGTNPVMLEVVKEVGQLPDTIVEHFGKDKLDSLADEKRLFYVSYDDLADITVNPHQAYPLPMNEGKPQNQERYCYAPIVLFELGSDRKTFNVSGIQLERNPDSKVYTSDNTGKNEWLFVKSCVATADSNMHQWVSHLGNTHLTMEPHIIAIHNVLRKAKHPLYTFLKPLCKDTLFLNWAARRTLAGYGAESFGDTQSSVGVGQFMQLIGKMWSRYSFFEKSALPNELANRGFDGDFDMPCYLFREDGMKHWNAYGDFATDFVNEIYDSDEAVAADAVVQEWAEETTDPDRGAVPGFPTSFEDKKTLAYVMQTFMWMTSGLHAAVNFPQYDFYSYVVNKPLGMRASLESMPAKDSDIREWMFEDFFPVLRPEEEWIEAATVSTVEKTHLLTLPSEDTLDELGHHFDEIGTDAYAKFLVKIGEIGDVVEARNQESKKNGEGVYSYLHPAVTPASIDI